MLKSLFEQLLTSADNTAIVESSGRTTYHELWSSIHVIHHTLKKRAETIDFICIFLPGGHWSVAAIMACAAHQKTYIPIDPNLASTRLPAVIEQTNCLVITNQKYAGFLPMGANYLMIERMTETAPCCPKLHMVGNYVADYPPKNPLYSIFTSGTTGEPKGVLVHYAGFENMLKWYMNEVSLTAQDNVLIASSIGFDLSQKNIFGTLIQGGTLVFVDLSPFDAFAVNEVIVNEQISLINCTPSTLNLLTDTHAISGFQQLQRVVLGGEPIGHELMQRWHHYLPHCKVLNTYGPTECADVVGAFWLTPAHVEQRLPIPIGYPIDNVELSLIDEAPDEQGRSVGEIVVTGIAVGLGYINTALNSAFELQSPPCRYQTGDLGYVEQGQLFYIGRKDRQIKYNGCLVNLAEIESCLLAQPHVQNAFVGYHAQHNALVACVSLENVAVLADIQFHVQMRLPSYMQPTEWKVCDALPLTANSKVDGNAIMASLFDEATPVEAVAECGIDTLSEQPALAESPVIIDTLRTTKNGTLVQDSTLSEHPIAQFLINNVFEITGIKQPVANIPLVKLGLNSIQTVQLLNRINRHYVLRIAPRELLHLPDLHAVVRLVEDRCKQNNENNDVIMSF